MFRPSWSGRVRGSKAWKEKALEGRKPRRGSAAGTGQLGSARTDSQEDQGFEAGEAGGTERAPSLGPRATGKRALGLDERELIVAEGNQATARERGRRGNRRRYGPGVGVPARRWITAREQSDLERGTRFLRGEVSEGRIPGTVAARNKAAKLGPARKPLRGSENLRAEPRVGLDAPLTRG
jgi:hypothetical protein